MKKEREPMTEEEMLKWIDRLNMISIVISGIAIVISLISIVRILKLH